MSFFHFNTSILCKILGSIFCLSFHLSNALNLLVVIFQSTITKALMKANVLPHKILNAAIWIFLSSLGITKVLFSPVAMNKSCILFKYQIYDHLWIIVLIIECVLMVICNTTMFIVIALMVNYMTTSQKKSGRKSNITDVKLQARLWTNAVCNAVSTMTVMATYLTLIFNSVDSDGESVDKYLLIFFPINAISNPILLTLAVA